LRLTSLLLYKNHILQSIKELDTILILKVITIYKGKQ
jgi:hypothetical protein